MTTVSLNAYEEAERTLARVEARRGITVHGVITAVVSVALILINVFSGTCVPMVGVRRCWIVGGVRLPLLLRVDARR